MRTILALLAALFLAIVALALPLLPEAPSPAAAHGDPVWRSGTYSMRLTQEPCSVPEYREYLEHVGIPPARAMVATQAGRPTIAGCWSRDMAGDILTRAPDEPPDAFPIPADWFKPGG